MQNNVKQADAPLRYVDITLSLSGDENRLICAAIYRANEAGMLLDFAEHAGLGIFANIFNKIAAASAEQGDPFARACCLRAGIPFGGGTDTLQ
ncbi:hypothetical protein [Burkholderia sp. BCC1977]|uniref:hypothetical protein n=1 Tax=Burkholderia sp. BCC1977 TaxID=2817440 RepID=UPI002ABDE2C4|nr:hypothetical protein [Burkholderia sp. BCC1977]